MPSKKRLTLTKESLALLNQHDAQDVQGGAATFYNACGTGFTNNQACPGSNAAPCSKVAPSYCTCPI